MYFQKCKQADYFSTSVFGNNWYKSRRDLKLKIEYGKKQIKLFYVIKWFSNKEIHFWLAVFFKVINPFRYSVIRITKNQKYTHTFPESMFNFQHGPADWTGHSRELFFFQIDFLIQTFWNASINNTFRAIFGWLNLLELIYWFTGRSQQRNILIGFTRRRQQKKSNTYPKKKNAWTCEFVLK